MNQDLFILAQGSESSAPELDMEFSDDTVNLARTVATLVGLVWVVYIVFRGIMPGGQGGRGMQAMMGNGMSGGKIAMAVIGIICLMDINYLVSITNFILAQIWNIKDSLASGDSFNF